MSVVVGAGTVVVVLVVVEVVVEVVVLVEVVEVVVLVEVVEVVVVACGDAAPASTFHGSIAAITTTAPSTADRRLSATLRFARSLAMDTRVEELPPRVKPRDRST